MFRSVMFFGLITSSLASEKSDVLVDATASFAVTIQEQFEMLVGDPAPAELAKKTIDYATAKTAYFNALRAEVSELIDIATSKETRPPGVDIFVAAFVVAGEEREKVADQKTLVLLKRFPNNPDIEKTRVKFERAQKLEQNFHRDFDVLQFTTDQLRKRKLTYAKSLFAQLQTSEQ
jgi:hypothetical protein